MSDIYGDGYGSDHDWQRHQTIFRATEYQCKKCGIWFRHHYPSTPSIFEAIAKADIPEKCTKSDILHESDE